MTIKTLKKFQKEYSYFRSIIKPQYKKYFDELADFYLMRKITNIKTVENHLSKLSKKGAHATAKKLDKLFLTNLIHLLNCLRILMIINQHQ